MDISITKAGKTLAVDPDSLPDEMFKLVVEEGLKSILNKGMSKVMTKGLEGDQLVAAQTAAMEIAEKNLEKLRKGEIKRGRKAGASKVPGEVMTEARRLAKDVVKDEIRAAGMRISHVPASEITKLANEMIASDPSFIEKAKANIEARKSLVPQGEGEDVKAAALSKLKALGFAGESPKLVAKAAAEKEARKSQLSAKQAGKVAPAKKKGAAAQAPA